MRDLVVMSLEPWDGVWRRNQHLLTGLLRRHADLRVLVAEPAADPVHAVRRGERPRPGRGLAPVGPMSAPGAGGRLWSLQPTKWLPRRADPGVDARLARATVRAVSRLGMRDPLLWVNDPAGAEVLRSTGWRALYDITDDWLLADRTPAEWSRLQRQEDFLMERCAEVVVCSPALERDKGRRRPVHLIPNAVDVGAYREPGLRPQDLPAAPVVLYVGTLHRDRLDVELCVSLSQALPEGTLTFVGPVALDAADRDRLTTAGARLLGPRAAGQVPAYLSHADVLVVPHVVTPFTESLDPIKAYEYRAAGRPVVSTPVAGFRDADLGRVRCATTTEDFVTQVRAALGRRREETSVLADDVPDWSDRVTQVERVLELVAASRRR